MNVHDLFDDVFTEIFGKRSALLPQADCARCIYRVPDQDGAHCYMFEDSPGPRCGQFKAEALKCSKP